MTLPGFPPALVARFAPRRALASGSYGHVFEATQVALDRSVAIKVLSESAPGDSVLVKRFDSEARVTAALSHPHIVVVLEQGVADGVPWIAYELLPGRSLRDALSNGPLALPLAVRAASQVADALEHAHAAGVVHRDIKADNVLETEPGRYKVADFGIARWAGSRVKTETGVILGTPLYIAPELVSGGEPSPASDLYALAVLTYELIAGVPPFPGDNPVQILTAHLSAPVPRLPGAPRELEELVTRGLAKEPAKRPSVAEFRAALDRIAGSLVAVRSTGSVPVRTLRATLPDRAIQTGAMRHRMRAGLAVATLAGVLLSGALALRPPKAPPPSVGSTTSAEAPAAARKASQDAERFIRGMDSMVPRESALRAAAHLRQMHAHLAQLPSGEQRRFAWVMAELCSIIQQNALKPSLIELKPAPQGELLRLLRSVLEKLFPVLLSDPLDAPGYKMVRFAVAMGELVARPPATIEQPDRLALAKLVDQWLERPRSFVADTLAATRAWDSGDDVLGARLFDEALDSFERRYFANRETPPSNDTVGTWYRLLRVVHERRVSLRKAGLEMERLRQSIQRRARLWADRCRDWASKHEVDGPCQDCTKRAETDQALADLDRAAWGAEPKPWPHAPGR